MTPSLKQKSLHVEELLDEALEESFPASNPVAVSPEPRCAVPRTRERAEALIALKRVPAPERQATS